ncbi:MAG: hypothetical protein WKG01_22665 [Kofleriaceae bacterium]
MRSFFVSCIVVAIAVVGLQTAEADKPNKTFAGKVMLSDKRFPAQAKSLAAFNSQIRKQSKTAFREDKEQKWKIYFAGFLKVPLNDVEYLVKIYDVTTRSQQLLASFEQFTDARGQTALLSHMTLDRKQVGVNKQLLITFESGGRVLASNRFKILGVGEKSSGKVDFSDDEAAGKLKEEE